jgi:hypothetical protein
MPTAIRKVAVCPGTTQASRNTTAQTTMLSLGSRLYALDIMHFSFYSIGKDA